MALPLFWRTWSSTCAFSVPLFQQALRTRIDSHTFFLRPMNAYLRAQERARLERDIGALKKRMSKKPPSLQNDAQRLASVLGSYARPAASALEKAYGDRKLLNMELKQERAPFEHTRGNQGEGRGRIHHSLPSAGRRRAHSVDPDSPSRRKSLSEEV